MFSFNNLQVRKTLKNTNVHTFIDLEKILILQTTEIEIGRGKTTKNEEFAIIRNRSLLLQLSIRRALIVFSNLFEVNCSDC